MSKTIIFLVKSFLGNFYRHLAIFFWSHCLEACCVYPLCAKMRIKVILWLDFFSPSYSLYSIGSERPRHCAYVSLPEVGCTQCCQIGLFFIVLGNKFSSKSSPNIRELLGYFEKCRFKIKNCCGYYLGILGNFWATFYYFVWSHWLYCYLLGTNAEIRFLLHRKRSLKAPNESFVLSFRLQTSVTK